MQEPDSQVPGAIVHPTAVVHPSVDLGDGVEVGPYAIIGSDSVIGAGTVVGPHCVVHDHVALGRNNQLTAHVVIGGRPQDKAYRGERTGVVIGDDNIFSEFASVDRATGEGNETRIGDGTYIMSCVKISHNSIIGNGAIVVSGSQLGGWVHLEEYAYVGGMSGVHQFCHIGRLVMVAGHSAVRQDVPPYVMVAGFQARAVGLNLVGLRRNGVSPADRLALRRVFRLFFRSGLPMAAAMQAIEAEGGNGIPTQDFLAFVRAARGRNRGIVRWQSETAS